MWISRNKWNTLQARLEAIEARAKESSTLTINTGKTKTEINLWGGGCYEAPVYAQISVRDALTQLIAVTGLCIDHTPAQRAKPEVTIIKKCDKKPTKQEPPCDTNTQI